jgi:hypothetical protein
VHSIGPVETASFAVGGCRTGIVPQCGKICYTTPDE